MPLLLVRIVSFCRDLLFMRGGDGCVLMITFTFLLVCYNGSDGGYLMVTIF